MDRVLLKAFRQRILAGIDEDLEREAAFAESSRREVLESLGRVLGKARANGRVGQAWLFGSFAWGLPTERSDVDVLVDGAADVDALAADIWRATDRPAHVIAFERAPRSLIDRVIREGTPL